MKHIEIYTDGACSGNPGPGGWGAILRFRTAQKVYEKELSGGEANTTNNRMEMTALLEALRQLEEQDGEAALRQARAILDDAGGALRGADPSRPRGRNDRPERCGQSMRHDRDGFSSAYPPGLFDQSQAVKSADALIAHPGDVGALNADI